MDNSVLREQELIEQFLAGNQSSLEELIGQHKNKVYTYILLMVKNQHLAEDILQDTFIKVIKSLQKGKYQDKGIFSSWVIRIAHNLVIDYFRKGKHMKMYSNDSGEIDYFNSPKLSDENIEDKLIQVQIESDVRNLVDLLPQDQRQVILLRHYGGLSFKEIAEQTDVSINTALGRMRYALINLRKLIKEKDLKLTKV